MYLRSGYEVWSAFIDSGGVDTGGYDKSLERELAIAIGLDPGEELLLQLKVADIDATRFLSEMLAVAAPYVLVFKAILEMAESISATQGRDNLDIEFDFGADGSLKLELEAFRVQARVVTDALRPMRVETWGYERFWKVLGALDARGGGLKANLDYPFVKVQAWAKEYVSGVWPDEDIEVPKSGHPGLDDLIRRVMLLRRAVTGAARRFGPKRDALRAFEVNRTTIEIAEDAVLPTNEVAGFLRSIHDDHWSVQVAGQAFACAEEAKTNPSIVEDVSRRLRGVLDDPPPVTREVKSAVDEWIALLRLPIWKKRHELYSVWVLTRIVNTLEQFSPIEFGFTDGKFDLPFRPKRLGTLQGVEPPVHIWSEVRTPLENPVGDGRSTAIQPDYILSTQVSQPPTAAFCVIEAKQYARPDSRRFAEALTDYARGHPDAEVALVNYGPCGATSLERVSADCRRRVALIGEFRPQSLVAERKWKAWLDRVLRDNCTQLDCRVSDVSAPMVRGFQGAECMLSWDASPRDLDLHVLTPKWINHHVNHSMRGSLDDLPWLKLDGDVTTGHGPETVIVRRAVRGRYRIAVHKYSQDGNLSGCGATVDVHLAGSDVKRFQCPGAGSGDWWHVCDVDFAAKVIYPIETISAVSPP